MNTIGNDMHLVLRLTASLVYTQQKMYSREKMLCVIFQLSKQCYIREFFFSYLIIRIRISSELYNEQ